MARASLTAASLRVPVDRVARVLAARARPLLMVAIAGLRVRPANAARDVTAAVPARAKAAPRGRRVRTGIRAMRPASRRTMPIREASTRTRIVRAVRARPAMAPAATALAVRSRVVTVRQIPVRHGDLARAAATAGLAGAVVAAHRAAIAECLSKGLVLPR